MCCDKNKPRARSVRTQKAVILSASGGGKVVNLPPSDNWAAVVVQSAVNTDTGNVIAQLAEQTPQADNTSIGQIASVALGTYGGASVVHVPPGARLVFVLDSFAGTGPVTAVVSSWAER